MKHFPILMVLAMNLHAPDGGAANTLRKTIEDRFFPFLKNQSRNRGNEKNEKKLESVLDVVKIETKGSSLSIKAKIDEPLIKKLMEN